MDVRTLTQSLPRALLTVALITGPVAAQDDILIGTVPLPKDVVASAPADGAFAGAWVGRWNTGRHHILVVEGINEDGRADVVYAVGSDWTGGGNWLREDARIEGDTLTFAEEPFSVRYILSPTGRLRGVLRENERFAILERSNLADLIASDAAAFAIGEMDVLDTDLVEDGRRVGLAAVIYRPPGKGPFPLALIHHGSTGDGTRQHRFDEVWTNDWLADLLNAHGWIAVFPQTRGRGGSDGVYDEGFAEDRSEGYSPAADLSLPGAERALTDANAALAVLRRRPDVTPGPVLLGGMSRGGVVAIMQAGDDPAGTAGVLNFVGGWTSEGWGEASINPTLFGRVGAFSGPVLSIYGEDDPFYSIGHTRSNLAELEARGASSRLRIVDVPGFRSGHWVLSVPALWEDAVSAFLDEIEN